MAEAGDWKAPDEWEEQQRFPEQGPQCTAPPVKNDPGGGRQGAEAGREPAACTRGRSQRGPALRAGGRRSPLLRGFGAGIKGRRKEKKKRKAPNLPSPPGEPEGVSPTLLTDIPPPPSAGEAAAVPGRGGGRGRGSPRAGGRRASVARGRSAAAGGTRARGGGSVGGSGTSLRAGGWRCPCRSSWRPRGWWRLCSAPPPPAAAPPLRRPGGRPTPSHAAGAGGCGRGYRRGYRQGATGRSCRQPAPALTRK